GPMARFMARPWGPPNSGSQAITRLMAGGSAKTWVKHALESSKSRCASREYSAAFLKRTGGITFSSASRPGRKNGNDVAGSQGLIRRGVAPVDHGEAGEVVGNMESGLDVRHRAAVRKLEKNMVADGVRR